ncbi:MAG: photosystem II cytochrome PsbV2 [Microcoleaceae cyanobacterium]
MRRTAIYHFLLATLLVCLGGLSWGSPAQAQTVDSYVRRYLASEPVEIQADPQGNSKIFTPEELTKGKELFEASCLNCHTGGLTLPYPQVSLSLEALQGATPSRDNIETLVTYFRHPLSYDGSDTNYWCREIPETWLDQAQVEQLAAYLVRSAEKAPNWGRTIEQNPYDLINL